MKHRIVRLIIVTLLASFLSVAAQADKWYQKYETALEFIDDGDGATAITLLEAAIEEQDEPAKRKRTHGMYFIEYYPYLHLGRAYLQTGNAQQAHTYCEKAADFGTAPKDAVKACLETSPPPIGTPVPQKVEIEILSKIPQATDADTLELRGIASSGHGIADVQVTMSLPGKGTRVVKDVPVEVTVQQFRADLPLEIGENSIVITARDRAGQVAKEEMMVVRVSLLPTLTWLSQIPTQVNHQQEEMEIWGSVDDRQGIRSIKLKKSVAPGLSTILADISLDHEPQTYDLRRVIPLTPGSNEIVIIASNRAGQKLTETLEIFRADAATVGSEFGHYHALVIGNDAYRYVPELETAKNDARAVSEVLRQEYGFTVTELYDATRADIVTSLNRYRKSLTENDNLLIYYAGHGYLDTAAEKGYWLPVDAQSDSNANWVSNDTVVTELKAIQAKHVLVVSDSCYSGTLTRGMTMDGIKPPDYLKRLAAKITRTVLTSGGDEPVVDAGGEPGHSVFASAFMNTLRENREPVIDTAALFPAIRRRVMLNAEQEPLYSDIRGAGGELGGDFLFVRTQP